MSGGELVTGLAIVAVEPALGEPTLGSRAGAEFPAAWSLGGARRMVDQREVPCCVSCALVAAAESAHRDWEALSPLFHYFVTRTEILGGGAGQEANISLESAKAALEEAGICVERLHEAAMDREGVAKRPSAEARADARGRRLRAGSLLPRLSRVELLGDRQRVAEWKKALLTGRPIVAGIELPVGYGKAMRRASTAEGRLGVSHAVTILGYRDSEQAFVVQDSRGPEWFLGGQWWMPYSFAESGFVYRAYAFRFR